MAVQQVTLIIPKPRIQTQNRFTIGDTWIKVRGYIRQGSDPTIGSFTYIEAITVEAMPNKGTETVK